MKTNLSYIIFTIALSACNTKTQTTEQGKFAQSFEVGGASGHNTINLIDGNGMKQGLWLMTISKDTVVYKNDTAYSIKLPMTSGEMIRKLKSGLSGPFKTYDSLTVRSY